VTSPNSVDAQAPSLKACRATLEPVIVSCTEGCRRKTSICTSIGINTANPKSCPKRPCACRSTHIITALLKQCRISHLETEAVLQVQCSLVPSQCSRYNPSARPGLGVVDTLRCYSLVHHIHLRQMNDQHRRRCFHGGLEAHDHPRYVLARIHRREGQSRMPLCLDRSCLHCGALSTLLGDSLRGGNRSSHRLTSMLLSTRITYFRD
jgi:hypothetical protein